MFDWYSTIKTLGQTLLKIAEKEILFMSFNGDWDGTICFVIMCSFVSVEF